MTQTDEDQAKPCPFCRITQERIVFANELAFVERDRYPLTKGHSLIIPRRHVRSLFDTSEEERLALFELLDRTKADIDQEFGPDGYNIGINDGAPAGQTVMHLHIHVIPRYLGDTSDPRGGIRWMLPERAAYWKKQR
jgi:diadenosine tetraphosphate (Ap4A) HIT family hydrolase